MGGSAAFSTVWHALCGTMTDSTHDPRAQVQGAVC